MWRGPTLRSFPFKCQSVLCVCSIMRLSPPSWLEASKKTSRSFGVPARVLDSRPTLFTWVSKSHCCRCWRTSRCSSGARRILKLRLQTTAPFDKRPHKFPLTPALRTTFLLPGTRLSGSCSRRPLVFQCVWSLMAVFLCGVSPRVSGVQEEHCSTKRARQQILTEVDLLSANNPGSRVKLQMG